MTPARSRDVDVVGGGLRVVEWGAPDAARPVVLAIHGITANHLTWEPLVELLPERRVIAADLRGRGRSAGIDGPWGMEQHALDQLALLDAAGVEKAFVVAHSMGASVAMMLRHLAPERVTQLLLVDGGLPLPNPYQLTPEAAVALLLGPALDRLTMTFSDRGAYRQFWQQHPSFQEEWTDVVERYIQYDLVEHADGFRSSVRRAAAEADFVDQMKGTAFRAATKSLEDVAFEFLRAPRGLLNQQPSLYPAELLSDLEGRYPGMRWSTVEEVNHYTILLGDRGARAVAAAVDRLSSGGG
jgi:lipase